MKLDPFYPIVDSAALVARLVPLGVRLIQLRIKTADDEALRREISASQDLCTRHGCQLVVNDYWQLAIEEHCDFIHLGQEDLAEADLVAIRRAGLRLGVSSHDEAELETALAAGPDYVALGPIYPTILKKMKWAPQGLERIGIWKARIGELPLVAIGGLTLDRLSGVFEAGAQVAAVVTDIMRNDNPEEQTRAWIRATDRWRR